MNVGSPRQRRSGGAAVRRALAALAALAALVAGRPSDALGQSAAAAPSASGARVELALGAAWLGGLDLGVREAVLASNGVPTGPGSTLFRADAALTGSPALDARLGVRLTPTITVEGTFTWARPDLSVRIADDRETGDRVVAREVLDQFTLGGGLAWSLPRWRLADRFVPFVSAGAAYLRQLHEGRALVDAGAVYHAGGGVRWPLRDRSAGWVRHLGARLEASGVVRTGGVEFADGLRLSASAGASVTLGF